MTHGDGFYGHLVFGGKERFLIKCRKTNVTNHNIRKPAQ